MHPVHVIPSTCSPESVAILAVAMVHDGGSTVSTKKRDGLLVDGLKTWEEREANKENWMIFVTPPMQRSTRSKSCSRSIGLTSTRDGSQFSMEMLAVSNIFKQPIPYRHNQGAEENEDHIHVWWTTTPTWLTWGVLKAMHCQCRKAPSWCCFGMCGLVGCMASSQVASIGKIVSKQSKIDTNLVKYVEEEKAWWFPFARISTEAAVATAVPQRLSLLRSATLFWRRTLHVRISEISPALWWTASSLTPHSQRWG